MGESESRGHRSSLSDMETTQLHKVVGRYIHGSTLDVRGASAHDLSTSGRRPSIANLDEGGKTDSLDRRDEDWTAALPETQDGSALLRRLDRHRDSKKATTPTRR